MYICSRCSGSCDAGELRGGVCDDCREEEEPLEIRKEQDRKMRARSIVEQADGQLVFNYASGTGCI